VDSISLILTIAGVVAAITAIVGGLVAIYKIARKIDDAVGTDEHGKTLSDRMSRVEHQLWENGGSSLADRVNKIDTSMTKTSAEVEIIKDFLMSGQLAHAEPAIIKTRATRKKAS
jgi:uncharacterized membrane protein